MKGSEYMSGYYSHHNKTNGEPPLDRRKAAIYVRMSTDHQKYSIENQSAAMESYAARHQMDVVKTYTDGGKSGLSISGREGLQGLIADVKNGTIEYSVILVLDVTRWGRFQDADESAYYEFTCRKAGYDVRYVAEQFENDGSIASGVFKSMKRLMAGEYSRELSVKVFAGQCRLIEKGFRQGGPAGYGLRRMLIDEHKNPKGELSRGQHKSLQTDRVILVRGPEDEVRNVQSIYKAFVEEGLTELEIAQRLNMQGILTDWNRPWTRSTIHQVLTNEKYIGNNIYNRRSYKLKEKRTVNKPEMWIRSDGVFDAIIEPRYFYAAQGIIQARCRKISNEELLDKLKSLQEKQGWLSGVLIDESEDMPSSSVYSHRFGGLRRAYELIGYDPGRDFSFVEDNRYLRSLYPEVVENIIDKIKEFGGGVHRDVTHDFLVVNDEIKVSVVICRCKLTDTGSTRWKIQFDTGLMPDITIAVRMDQTNRHILDYYVIPSIDVENPQIRLAENNHFALDTYRFERLEPFFVLTERVPLLEVA
jgi:DNA invertase Pin-like site-specific DNA recombinase